MSRRRGQSAPAVTLFPFLAVLLCAMGSLILLLLIITQRVGPNSVLRTSVNKAEIENSGGGDSREPEDQTSEESENGLVSSEQADHRVSEESESIEKSGSVVRQAELPEADLFVTANQMAANKQAESEWRNSLSSARAYRPDLDGEAEEYLETQRHLRQREQLQKEFSWIQQELSSVQKNAQEKQTGSREIQQQLLQLEMLRQQLQESEKNERNELQKQLDGVQELKNSGQLKTEEMASVEQELQQRKNKLEIVTFDGPSGVQRQPVIVECKAGEVVFHPEKVSVSLSDLEDFSPKSSPLKAGIEALVEYRSQKKGEKLPPYVLMIGRPNGIEEFYACGQVLTVNRIPFGYELISQQHELYAGKIDAESRRLLLEAIGQARQQRRLPQSRFARLNAMAEEEEIIPRLMREAEPAGPRGNSIPLPRPFAGNSRRPEPEGESRRGADSASRPGPPQPAGSVSRQQAGRGTASSPPLSSSTSSSERVEFSQRDASSRQKLTESLSEIQQEFLPAPETFVPPAPKDQQTLFSENSPLKEEGSWKSVSSKLQEKSSVQGGRIEPGFSSTGSSSSSFSGSESSASESSTSEFSRSGSEGMSDVSRVVAQPDSKTSSSARQSGFRPIEAPAKDSGKSRQQSRKGSLPSVQKSISVERKVVIQVYSQGVKVGQQNLVSWDMTRQPGDFSELLWRLTERELSELTPPPEGFSWIPVFHLQIAPGGNQLAFQIEKLASESSFRVTSEVLFQAARVSEESLFR